MLGIAPMPLPFPVPDNEEDRLQDVLAYRFTDGGAEASLDQICLLAQSVFDVPIALITLVGRDQQTFLAKCGVDANGTSRKDAFCSYTILGDTPFVVPDATQDERFAANPLVTGDMHIRFYAGAPLTVRPGIAIGALCLIDTKPREFTEADAARLKMLGNLAVNELRRRRTMIDLRRQQDLSLQTARMTGVGSWSIDLKAGTIFWSDETYRIFEVDPAITPTQEMVEGFWIPEHRPRIGKGMEQLILYGAPFDQELEIVTAKGSRRWVRCIAEAEVADGAPVRINASLQDITRQREHALEIERLAFQDALTGLPNRALFQKQFAAALAEAGAPDDLLDRNASFKQRHDGRIGFLAALVPVILQALGAGQEGGVDHRCTDDGADLAHGLAHSVQKRPAGILHQMPVVGDLLGRRQGLGRRLAIPAAAIPRDDSDRRMMPQPSLGRRRFLSGNASDNSTLHRGWLLQNADGAVILG